MKPMGTLFRKGAISESLANEAELKRKMRAVMDEHLAPHTDSIHAATQRAIIKFRAGTFLHTHTYTDARQRITIGLAGAEFERMVDLFGMGRANESQLRVVASVLENPDRLTDVVEASMKLPGVNRFWRWHAKTHDMSKPVELSEAGKGLLGQILRDHYATIPDITDLHGRSDRRR